MFKTGVCEPHRRCFNKLVSMKTVDVRCICVGSMVYYNSFLHQPPSLKHLGSDGDLLPPIFSELGVQRAFGVPEINQKAKYIGSFLCHAEKSDLRKNLFWLTI